MAADSKTVRSTRSLPAVIFIFSSLFSCILSLLVNFTHAPRIDLLDWLIELGHFCRTRTWTQKNIFFWTRTRIKLFEFIRKIFKLWKRNKRLLRNIVCCSSSHHPCKLKLWFYQKKSCKSFICSCHCDLWSQGLRSWTGTRWTRSFLPNWNSNLNSKNKILRTRTCKYRYLSNSNLVKNRSSLPPWNVARWKYPVVGKLL